MIMKYMWEYHTVVLNRFADWIHDTDYSFVMELINSHLSEYIYANPFC